MPNIEACTDCGHWRIAYNGCLNRHCSKCQGAAEGTWLADREAALLLVGYFHVALTLPAQIAFQNKAVVSTLAHRCRRRRPPHQLSTSSFANLNNRFVGYTSQMGPFIHFAPLQTAIGVPILVSSRATTLVGARG